MNVLGIPQAREIAGILALAPSDNRIEAGVATTTTTMWNTVTHVSPHTSERSYHLAGPSRLPDTQTKGSIQSQSR